MRIFILIFDLFQCILMSNLLLVVNLLLTDEMNFISFFTVIFCIIFSIINSFRILAIRNIVSDIILKEVDKDEINRSN